MSDAGRKKISKTAVSSSGVESSSTTSQAAPRIQFSGIKETPNEIHRKKSSTNNNQIAPRKELRGLKETPNEVRQKPSTNTAALSLQEEGNKSKESTQKPLVTGDELVGNSGMIWEIKAKLGSGGFGDVFEVTYENYMNGMPFALKVEFIIRHKMQKVQEEKEEKKSASRLKTEVNVLCAVKQSKKSLLKRHFAEIIDRGLDEKTKYKFIVMTLLGFSLSNLKTVFVNEFSTPTNCYIALQTLECIKDLHEIGFIHRDIKPHNFTTKLRRCETELTIIDFGIARSIYKKDGTIRPAREQKTIRFVGTRRYCSTNCHEQKEQSRKDDLESWIFMICETFDHNNGLTWTSDESDVLICEKKKQFMTGNWSHLSKVPIEFVSICSLISKLGYEDTPPYDTIKKTIDDYMKAKNIKINLEKLDYNLTDESGKIRTLKKI